jgi:D-3-phosphoglycerate dehydrogenase
MTWKILISAPYFLPVVEDYRSQLEAEGLELVVADVGERLSEEDLLPLVACTMQLSTICLPV